MHCYATQDAIIQPGFPVFHPMHFIYIHLID